MAELTFNAVVVCIGRWHDAAAREGHRYARIYARAFGRRLLRVWAPKVKRQPPRVERETERFLLLHRIEIESAVAQWIRCEVVGPPPGRTTDDIRTRVRRKQR